MLRLASRMGSPWASTSPRPPGFFQPYGVTTNSRQARPQRLSVSVPRCSVQSDSGSRDSTRSASNPVIRMRPRSVLIGQS